MLLFCECVSGGGQAIACQAFFQAVPISVADYIAVFMAAYRSISSLTSVACDCSSVVCQQPSVALLLAIDDVCAWTASGLQVIAFGH